MNWLKAGVVAASLAVPAALAPFMVASGDPNVDTGVGSQYSRGPYGFNNSYDDMQFLTPPNSYGVYRDVYGALHDSGTIPDNLTTRVPEQTWDQQHPIEPHVSGAIGGLGGAGLGGFGGFAGAALAGARAGGPAGIAGGFSTVPGGVRAIGTPLGFGGGVGRRGFGGSFVSPPGIGANALGQNSTGFLGSTTRRNSTTSPTSSQTSFQQNFPDGSQSMANMQTQTSNQPGSQRTTRTFNMDGNIFTVNSQTFGPGLAATPTPNQFNQPNTTTVRNFQTNLVPTGNGTFLNPVTGATTTFNPFFPGFSNFPNFPNSFNSFVPGGFAGTGYGGYPGPIGSYGTVSDQNTYDKEVRVRSTGEIAGASGIVGAGIGKPDLGRSPWVQHGLDFGTATTLGPTFGTGPDGFGHGAAHWNTSAAPLIPNIAPVVTPPTYRSMYRVPRMTSRATSGRTIAMKPARTVAVSRTLTQSAVIASEPQQRLLPVGEFGNRTFYATEPQALGKVTGSMTYDNGDITTFGSNGTLRRSADNSGTLTLHNGNVFRYGRLSPQLRHIAVTKRNLM